MRRKVDKLRHERTDRESRVVIDAERKASEAKTTNGSVLTLKRSQ